MPKRKADTPKAQKASPDPAEGGGARAPGAAKPLRSPLPAESGPLLHELRVHQIELELQNEELRSARLETERALARYTELFDFAPIGYATVGLGQAIHEINLAGAQLLGMERSRIRGQRFEQLVCLEQRPLFLGLLRSAEASGNKESCELELALPLPRGGQQRLPVRLSATVLVRSEPTLLMAFEDISESRRREQRLERTEHALRDADRRKDDFLATLSHELRNPLAPIRNSVFVLARSPTGSEAATRAQLIIERQVTHLTRLIDDLLDVTRIARGKIQLQLDQVELGALLRQTLEDHRESFNDAGVQLTSQLDAAPVWVRADTARLVQIVSNLLTNALKFTGRSGQVSVQLQSRDGACLFSVSDTGVGIPPGMLEHVFEAFAQAPQTLERAHGGLGLGLAMVKGLVELHEGSVSISSAGLDRGTAVTVSLPSVAAPEALAQRAAPRARRGRRVLLIEDNEDASDTLQVALTLNGHQVATAPDGKRGLELALEVDPEIVICDIGLPGMDGYEVARAFRASERLRHLYLVALSGYARPEDLQRARDAGFNQHLAKPTSPDVLDRILSEAPDPPAANELSS